MSSSSEIGEDAGAGEEDETLAHFLESEILSVEVRLLHNLFFRNLGFRSVV